MKTTGTTVLAQALEPCPFCGATGDRIEITPWHGGGPDKHMISCTNDEECEALPAVTGETRELAIAAWNRRAAITSLRAADAGVQPSGLHGFNRDDLADVAAGLEMGYQRTVNVGDATGEGMGDTLLESGTAYAARFIRAHLSASPAAPAPQPLHPNHLPDLRYVRKVLDDVRALALVEGDTLCGDVDAAVVGMDYIIKRTEEAAEAAASPAPQADEWSEAQRICDLPAVDEAIHSLLEDHTGDNATCLIREVLRAASPAVAPSAQPVQAVSYPDSVREALQRLIENAAILGPASREDALVIARWRGQFLTIGAAASGKAVEVPVTLDQVAALAKTMWKGEPVPGRVLRFGAAVLGLADAATPPASPEPQELGAGKLEARLASEATDALFALFRENELPMSDRNGRLHDKMLEAFGALERRAASASQAASQPQEPQAAGAHYPEEWGPSTDRRLTCSCGHPDPAHMDKEPQAGVSARLTDGRARHPTLEECEAAGRGPSNYPGKPYEVGGLPDTPSGDVLPNLWLGATVVNREEMLRDAAKLQATPARVRFWSVEPMLSDLGEIPRDLMPDWVIAGGESGPGARPMHPDWARSLRDQCAAAGVPFMFKQWGEFFPKSNHPGLSDRDVNPNLMVRIGKRAAGRQLDGVEHNGFPEVAHG